MNMHEILEKLHNNKEISVEEITYLISHYEVDRLYGDSYRVSKSVSSIVCLDGEDWRIDYTLKLSSPMGFENIQRPYPVERIVHKITRTEVDYKRIG